VGAEQQAGLGLLGGAGDGCPTGANRLNRWRPTGDRSWRQPDTVGLGPQVGTARSLWHFSQQQAGAGCPMAHLRQMLSPAGVNRLCTTGSSFRCLTCTHAAGGRPRSAACWTTTCASSKLQAGKDRACQQSARFWLVFASWHPQRKRRAIRAGFRQDVAKEAAISGTGRGARSEREGGIRGKLGVPLRRWQRLLVRQQPQNSNTSARAAAWIALAQLLVARPQLLRQRRQKNRPSL